ncbi:unnamed protein product, partial [Symbiodinium sp. KB8]
EADIGSPAWLASVARAWDNTLVGVVGDQLSPERLATICSVPPQQHRKAAPGRTQHDAATIRFRALTTPKLDLTGDASKCLMFGPVAAALALLVVRDITDRVRC